MTMPMLALGVVASAIQQKNAERDAKKQAQIDIMKQQAASLGAPTYTMQAAQFNKDLADKPTLTDQLLQGYASKKIGAGLDEDEQDLLKGL